MVSCRGCSQLMHLKTVKTIAEPGVVSNEDWSPDGKYIAIGIWSESHINVYDTENWKLLGSLAVQNDNEGRGVKFLMNDDLIIPAVAAGDRLNTIPNLDDNVSAEEWNFKKKLIVKKFRTSFTYDKNAQEFSRTLTPVDVQWASFARAIAVSSDGRLVATSVYTGATIYDSTNAQVVQNIKCETHFSAPQNPYTVSYESPYAISFSPDGKKLTLIDCSYNKISTYDVNSGSLIYETSIRYGGGGFDAIEYNSDGSLIAVGTSGNMNSHEFAQVTILRASDGTIIGSSPGEGTFIEKIQWVPGKNLVLASYQALYGFNWDTGASLEGTDKSDPRIWDGTTLSLVDEFGGSQLGAAAFSADGTKIAFGVKDKVVVVSVK